MDLEILEGLALSADRGAALRQLLPGSEDHDYYTVIALQHAGKLDEAETILEAWSGRHGGSDRLERLRLRQLLYRLDADPADVADDVRDRFGVSHWHEAQVDSVDPSRPTRIPDGAFDPNRLLRDAINQYSDLSQVTDDGILELLTHPLGAELDTSRRRALLQRTGHSPTARLVQLVIADLETGNTSFGSQRSHHDLTRTQLEAVAAGTKRVAGDATFIDAMLRRMRPPAYVDLLVDRAARDAYLVELWQYVSTLSPASNSLKGHVLWHLLDSYRQRNTAPPRDLVLTYLQLPRSAGYVASRVTHNVHGSHVARIDTDFRNSTGLPPAGNDEGLVRWLIERDPDEAQASYGPFVETSWLEAELATAHLLRSSGNADRATHVLGPSRAAELRERVEIAWCAHNPTQFAADAPIVLEADVKHVPELVVKVFRIDPLAYFQHHRREVNTDLDLDGLAASHELVMTFPEPPIRRVRRRIELPTCARPGTYVIDLIGNGMSSRAVVRKGNLRAVTRTGAAGHVVTIVDDAGAPRPDARAWIGDREYTPDTHGAFVVPFSTQPTVVPMLIACGDIAVVSALSLESETYSLSAEIQLDRQALTEGGTARAVARLRLAVSTGVQVSLAALENPLWDIVLTDRHGVTTAKLFPLTLTDDNAAVLEFPLGEAPAHVTLTVRGKVRVLSQQRDQELATSSAITFATMHGQLATEALYLASTARGWVLTALGKTGEPRAQRPLSVYLTHRWAHTQAVVELATDANGRCELGELPGVHAISANLGGTTFAWIVREGELGERTLYVAPHQETRIPLPPDRDAAATIAQSSLVELRASLPFRHVTDALRPLAGAIAISGLAPGDYSLRMPGTRGIVLHVPAEGPRVDGSIVAPTETVELSREVPVLASVRVSDAVELEVAGATPRTRVHVIATRFFATPIARVPAQWRAPGFRGETPRIVNYVSGRELGDEYRYVLDRRNAKRFPTLQLDKPSLLLNPWSRRTTTTDVATAKGGGAFGASADRMRSMGYAAAAPEPQSADDMAAYASYDFLPAAPVVIVNLVPDRNGRVRVPLKDLGTATCVTIVLDDPLGSTLRRLSLAETPLAPKDLRLRLALDPARHTTQKKAVTPLRTGESIVIDDLATAKVHLIDAVDKAHAYLLALGDNATLREWSWITRWHSLPDGERRELYSKHACHELHLFLYRKDRAFFDAVVRPYLAHKRTKTFLDHYLLDADLRPYFEPWRFARLNAVERALLAQRFRADPALVRVLGDAVEIQPPDPGRDTHLIDALLGASRLDADSAIAGAAKAAFDDAYAKEEATSRSYAAHGAGGPGFAPPAPSGAMMPPPAPAAAAPPPRPMKKLAKMEAADESYDAPEMLEAKADISRDMEYRREQQAPMFRAADKTQEWAEHNWFHATPADSDADFIAPNKLWRDLALHGDGPFLSPWLGLATNSFAEAMCALALTDLPFVAGAHAVVPDGARLTITAAAHALAGSSQLVDGPLVEGGAPLVVGQSYVRTDDRHRWIDGEQVDKYVEGPFLVGVVYTCQVVLANPSSTRQRIAALIQIPKGSLPLAGARQTHTLEVVLEPYGTHGHEYAFYFPQPGRYTHFPVHVSRGGQIVAAAPPRVLEVSATAVVTDPHSWSHVSQRGTLDEVVAYLKTQNLADIELDLVCWRLKERDAYEAILRALEERHVFHDAVWGYALLHEDLPRISAWVRTQDELRTAGLVLDMPVVGLDGEDLGTYEYLEYAPLTNARAHRLGPKLRILNEGLKTQYERFLELCAHRKALTAEDRLAAAAYLLAQDRNEPALEMFAQVQPAQLADRMQYDYLAAYTACLTGNTTAARELVSRWRQLPVDRWRRKFEALAAMLDELTGSAPTIVDSRSREQQQAELAAKQPTFDITVDRDGVLVRQQNVTSLELRYFVMDVELLFSRQPFVQSDVSRFSFIEPGHREALTNPGTETRIPWPAALRGKNVVVEAVGVGQRKAKIHYANDLATNLAHQYGQVRVQRASDQAPLSATYVKVYAKQKSGAVSFYKDGYTDLRGWFDYATLSTNDLDNVDRFAILVCSDQAGAAILEANPPAR